ncbi:MAG: ATP/GTP-binding protein [Nocardioides sp.]
MASRTRHPSTPPQDDQDASPAPALGRNRRSPRGFRGRGGGAWNVMPTPPTFRGTSVQVCGMWPFAGGSSRPVIGVPVGQDIQTGSTVCCDPFAWFRHGLISSPSMTVFGLQGFGKSSFTVRQMLGLADRGVVPMVAGDLKGEYTAVTRALGGQVLRFGEDQRLNVLDLGAMAQAADRIGGTRGEELREIAIDRSALMVTTLVQIVRRSHVRDFEASLVSAALRILHDTRGTKAPTLPDLAGLLHEPPSELLRLVLAEDEAEYRLETRPLLRSIRAVLDGPLGRTFSGQSTERLDIDAPAVSIDISAVEKRSTEVLASVMLATWSETFASVEAANALADAGVAPQRHFLTVMDEMWRPMRLEGAGLVDKLDAITRLNRNEGTGNIFITHSLKDLESMTSAADVQKARGFAERSGIVVTAALAKDDLRALSEVKRMSEAEINTVASWSTPPGWEQKTIRDPVTGQERPAPPPDAGKVLIKLGERAGIQTQVKLTPTELALHDTNQRWITAGTPPPPASTR